MMPDAASPLSHLLSAWHPAYVNAFLAAAVCALMLVRVRPDGPALLRNALVFALVCVLLVVGSGITDWMGFRYTAGLLDGSATVALGVLVIRLAGLALFRVILPVLRLHPPRILEDILLVLAYAGWGLVQLHQAGVNLSSLVATSAVITAIVAFSMQDTLGNILGGLGLQLDNSIHIGDWIKIDDVSGCVVEVHWRHTAVRTRNGEIAVLPNSLLMKSKFLIVGRDDTPQWRRWVYFSVGYQVPPQRVIAAVEKALGEADIANVSTRPLPQCVVMDFKEGSTHYAVRYWLTNPRVDDSTDSAVRMHIYAALQRQGYVLAHPCLDVNMSSSDAESAAIDREHELAIRRKTLRRIELFSHLSDDEIAHLAAQLTYAQFVRGGVMTRQGAVAHWLYVLISGEADVWYEAEGQPRRHLTTLEAGRVFGEMGMMTGEPRRATVTARTDAECYRIDKSSFEGIMQSRPGLAEEFARILMERNRQLVAVAQEKQPADHAQQHARLLASIRRFFRLDPA
jgi:small-conductance mechanosensitive channel/CRP-like cAMP-binding protein